MEEKIIMTQEGYQKTKERLEYLKTTKRQEVAKKLAEARSYGDLSENAEYDNARQEQISVEEEIFQLESQLKNVEVVDSKKISSKTVGVGCKVTVTNLKTKKTAEYKIVGDADSDPFKGLISNAAPVGAGLMGKKVGDIANIKTPAGITQLRVDKIKV